MRILSLSGLALIAVACGASGGGGPTGPSAFGGLPPGPIGTTGAQRLLIQGTFGATLDGVNSASGQTYAQWFADQASQPVSKLVPQVPMANSDLWVPWWTQAVTAPDQLRQRVAFTLSQILVVSAAASSQDSISVSNYADLLAQGAFGNFRDLLEAVTKSPAMGQYLTYFRSDKPNPATGSHADENYAREIMQLFTIGLVKLNPDGTEQMDGSGNPIPTYGLPEIENLARVFTGWASNPIAPHMVSDDSSWKYDVDNAHPMVPYEAHHDTGAKTIIGGVNIPAGGTCESDLKIALDTLFHHPNVGPFLGKQLIQRLVTSNPSPAYVQRVAAAFENDGHGTRGDMLAVVEAVLTDSEARTAGSAAKLREPVLRFTELFRAYSAIDLGGDGKIAEYLLVNQGNIHFGQGPWESPTVFNFFRPDYTRPGPLLSANLVAPEFQITNEYSSVLLTNQLEYSTYQYVDSSGAPHSMPDNYTMMTGPQSVMLHTKDWEGFASDAGNLVDHIAGVLMAGQMSAAMRKTVVDYVNLVPSSNPALRVAEATFLIASSPQYAVQR